MRLALLSSSFEKSFYLVSTQPNHNNFYILAYSEFNAKYYCE